MIIGVRLTEMHLTVRKPMEPLTWRQRLESTIAQYERAEKELGQRYALRELTRLLDDMWRIAQDQQHELLKQDIKVLGI